MMNWPQKKFFDPSNPAAVKEQDRRSLSHIQGDMKNMSFAQMQNMNFNDYQMKKPNPKLVA